MTCTSEMLKRDYKFVSNGAVFQLLSNELYLLLRKCTKNIPAQALVDYFGMQYASFDALNFVKA